ncbi:hypothetical protein [Mycolicibacterium doricum]|uniref:hypothetical protein n=1 Tax=Mycolicibacterium doricum TaxID=126673 RepID=UPI0035577710
MAPVVEAWDGWQPSLRDFTWGAVGTEVKTTTGSASTHDIQGTHQVELADGTGGVFVAAVLVRARVWLVRPPGSSNSALVDLLLSHRDYEGQIRQFPLDRSPTSIADADPEVWALAVFGHQVGHRPQRITPTCHE